MTFASWVLSAIATITYTQATFFGFFFFLNFSFCVWLHGEELSDRQHSNLLPDPQLHYNILVTHLTIYHCMAQFDHDFSLRFPFLSQLTSFTIRVIMDHRRVSVPLAAEMDLPLILKESHQRPIRSNTAYDDIRLASGFHKNICLKNDCWSTF
jgi:hypothetical protein